MKNPSEELTTAWLQECKHFFTMSNIKVKKPGGGMGSEIDILAINQEKRIWAEVSVSTNPRAGYKAVDKFESIVRDYAKKFESEDKRKQVEALLGKEYERWLIYGELPFKKEDKERFPTELERRGILAIYFGEVFKDLMSLTDWRLDSARGYMNLFKTFGDVKIQG